MKELGLQSRAPIVLINWTNEEGARFFPLLGSSIVYAGRSTIAQAHAASSNDASDVTMGSELAKIGYVGDGPNTFEEFPISAHFEIHCEQNTDLEKAGKSVGWVEGWEGMTWYDVHFEGEDGHANTYNMKRRKDALVGAAKVVVELEKLAYEMNGRTTVTGLHSRPWGACNIQSKTKTTFCLMHKDGVQLEKMGESIMEKVQSIAWQHGLDVKTDRTVHLLPGSFWPEAIDCVKRACGDKGIGSKTLTGHDSTMTTLLCPTAMVFARARDGISHSPKEWTDKEDCADSALVLGRAVLNFDDYLAKGSSS